MVRNGPKWSKTTEIQSEPTKEKEDQPPNHYLELRGLSQLSSALIGESPDPLLDLGLLCPGTSSSLLSNQGIKASLHLICLRKGITPRVLLDRFGL
jgi:hypothetical protein